MKLDDIPKKHPFKIPDEAHFEALSSKIYAQIEELEKNSEKQEEQKEATSISIQSENKATSFWVKPQIMGIAATLLLLLVATFGVYKYETNNEEEKTLAVSEKQLDFSAIPTEQISNFLLNEDISETELISFIPQNSTLEINDVLEESDLNSIDNESLDLMLEEEYL
ncbi:hypothetical protein [Bernardetia sp.]|uniref:hypothetical protein n=1 Tax=Bernardetia sp. TaxID=1937974 RepID=UPI0025B87CFF|nr:hypothetical protein [Bernardetia sp.]